MVQAKELPKEVIDRIVIRSAILDSLPDHALEKADFILEQLQNSYTGVLPDDDQMRSWSNNREVICAYIDITRDYVWRVQEELEAIRAALKNENEIDRERG